MNKQEKAQAVLKTFRKTYTDHGPFVEWSTPLELVVGTVLSAQCTDVRVNMVTKKLFKKYKTARDYARAKLPTLENDIKSTGFYRNKAKHLKGIGTILVEKHGGKVPGTYEELLELPGVGSKTAFLVMAKAFGQHVGIAVDTHVRRVAPRLGWTREEKNTDKIARDLEKLFPPRDFLDVNEFLILHGRATCSPRIPKCGQCPVQHLCPSAKKYLS